MKIIKSTITSLVILACAVTNSYSASLPDNLDWNSNDSAQPWASPSAVQGGTFTDFILSFPPTLRTVGPDSNSSFRSYIKWD